MNYFVKLRLIYVEMKTQAYMESEPFRSIIEYGLQIGKH